MRVRIRKHIDGTVTTASVHEALRDSGKSDESFFGTMRARAI
jgi:hypothetical protein